jgi:hypothetical protein
MIKYMGLGLINMHQEIYIKEIGNKENIMAKDKCNLLMDLNIKDSGKIIKCIEKENIKIQMEYFGKEFLLTEILKQKIRNSFKFKLQQNKNYKEFKIVQKISFLNLFKNFQKPKKNIKNKF